MIKPIKNNKQYELALSRIYDLMQKDLKPNSKDSDEIEILSILVKEHENEYFPMPRPTPLTNQMRNYLAALAILILPFEKL
jgi:HTH-type transcriptional regulator/antitoxin HigA